MGINWVARGTCYTKTEGTELGGIEGAETGFFAGVMLAPTMEKASQGSFNAAYFSSSPELLSPETKHYLILFRFLRNETYLF